MNVKEQSLGMAITAGLKSADGIGACPSLEEIACLVEGTLSGAERDPLLGHLAACGKCRQIFTSAKELSAEVSTEAVALPARRRFLLPSSLAAAAVLVVAVTLTMKHSPAPQVQLLARTEQPAAAVATVQPVPPKAAPAAKKNEAVTPVQPTMVAKAETHLFAASIARSLAEGMDPQQLASAAPAQSKSYGFAGDSGGNSAFFRIGMTALDLEVALLADDSDRAQGAATRLAALVQPLSGDDAAAEMERLVERLEKGEKAKSFAGKTGAITRLVPRDRLPYLRLGAWTEAARIAARGGNAAFLSRGVPPEILKELASRRAAPETARTLRELDQKLKSSKGELSSLDPELDALLRNM